MTNRRAFLTGITAIIAAPAIVRASSLMSIKPVKSELMLSATETWDFSTSAASVVWTIRGTDAFGNEVTEILKPGVVSRVPFKLVKWITVDDPRGVYGAMP